MASEKVKVMLDKPRTLLYDIEAASAIEEAANRSINQLLNEWGVRYFRLLIWGGLLHEEPGLTLDQATAILKKYCETHPLPDLRPAIIEAMSKSEIFGPKREGVGGNVGAAEGSSPSASGSN